MTRTLVLNDTMNHRFPLTTRRLKLIPATPALLAADRGDRRALSELLDAQIPSGWPPPLLDDETIQEFIRIQNEGSDPHFCPYYWILTDPEQGKRVLVGSGGTASEPDSRDSILIGYSVLEEFQGRGYATEAVQSITREMFRSPGILTILAATCPELKASIRVLEKNGFHPAAKKPGGTGMEEGTLLYVLTKTET